jgi:hypothetical protein
MRLFQVLIVTSAFLVASAAGAIEMSITSSTVGSQTTIDISLSNLSATTVQGIEIDLNGLAGVANVVSGQAAITNFAAFCGGGTCFGGVDSVKNAFFDRDNLAGGGYAAGDNSVELLRSLALQASTQTGAIDPGLPGLPGVDIRVVLNGVGAGTLDIVGRYSNGVDVLPFQGGSVTISAIPEPGTALLMGLGLFGLVSAGRRR